MPGGSIRIAWDDSMCTTAGQRLVMANKNAVTRHLKIVTTGQTEPCLTIALNVISVNGFDNKLIVLHTNLHADTNKTSARVTVIVLSFRM